jgi:hypothetical protein
MKLTITSSNAFAFHLVQAIIDDSVDIVECKEGSLNEPASRQVKVSRAKMKRWHDLIHSLSLPVYQPGEFVCDGVEYAVEICEGSTNSDYSWNSNLPSGWEPLGRLIKDVGKATKLDFGLE